MAHYNMGIPTQDKFNRGYESAHGPLAVTGVVPAMCTTGGATATTRRSAQSPPRRQPPLRGLLGGGVRSGACQLPVKSHQSMVPRDGHPFRVMSAEGGCQPPQGAAGD